MKKFLIACLLVFGIGLQASTTLLWDPVPQATDSLGLPIIVGGYIVSYGTQSGVYTTAIDVGNVVSTPINLPVGTYYFVVQAYNNNPNKALSAYSTELKVVIQPALDLACTPPLGSKIISIFPTNLQKTGSGGAGSKARLDFQVGSSSPVTHIAVKGNGVDLSVMDGTNLGALAGMWFTVPSAPARYVFSISAQNLYGCKIDYPTTYSINVK